MRLKTAENCQMPDLLENDFIDENKVLKSEFYP